MSKYYRSDYMVDAIQFNGQDIAGGFVNRNALQTLVEVPGAGKLLVESGEGYIEVPPTMGEVARYAFFKRGDWILTFPDGGHQVVSNKDFNTQYSEMPEVNNMTSDGYHTFQELYDHRSALFRVVVENYRGRSFKTRKTQDGREVPGWFIAGLNFPFGQISYHMADLWWDKLPHVPVYEKNTGYDNHTAADVLKRLERVTDYMPR